MAELTFQDLSFEDRQDMIRVNFLKIFYFEVDRRLLENIGNFKLSQKSISFDNISDARAQRKFNLLLSKGFINLKNKLNNKPAVYIHKHTGIPLTGTNYFGLIDRGTNIIEVKPLTGCNLGCIYCSVDEGPPSRRKIDFVVEKDYLVDEFKKLAAFKKHDYIDAHINAQGEPTLYADMVGLVRGIAQTPNVKMISIDSNGTLLTKQYIDELADAGLKRINLSLNAIDQKIATQLAGFPYNVKRVMEMARYITTKMDLIIAPVWLPGYNDDELVKLAQFANEIGAGKTLAPIGIQNFMPYRFGRNPVKPVELDVFYDKMKALEKKSGTKLLYNYALNVKECPEYPKPFKRGQIVRADLVCPGRIGNEMLAVAQDRVISIPHCEQQEGSVVVRIKRTKHNIFLGELVNK